MQTNLHLPSQLPAFTMIGPDAGYKGVTLRLKSVSQNCVLGRCIHVVFNHSATSPFLSYFLWKLA